MQTAINVPRKLLSRNVPTVKSFRKILRKFEKNTLYNSLLFTGWVKVESIFIYEMWTTPPRKKHNRINIKIDEEQNDDRLDAFGYFVIIFRHDIFDVVETLTSWKEILSGMTNYEVIKQHFLHI